MVIIFWDFLVFQENIVLPQANQSVIISNKNGVYQLPRKLPDKLRLATFKN